MVLHVVMAMYLVPPHTRSEVLTILAKHMEPGDVCKGSVWSNINRNLCYLQVMLVRQIIALPACMLEAILTSKQGAQTIVIPCRVF